MNLAVIGAGVTGLAAAMASGAPVFEQSDGPGGICRSYYLRSGEDVSSDHAPPDDDAYRFEVGGGHWIFGGDDAVLERLDGLATLSRYERSAAVRLGDDGPTVPYPLQAHVEDLGPAVAARVASERAMGANGSGDVQTLRDWLARSFGPTLCELFFFPFHDRYSAGLSGAVAPQDDYKSPGSRAQVVPAAGSTLGYNAEFRYPEGGLDALVGAMAERCDVRYGKRLVALDHGSHLLGFADGTEQRYDTLLSTMPLHDAVQLAGVDVGEPPDPFTSVLVLNIGADRGDACPDLHWLYDPRARSGFHRIGFYSNIDRSFLPKASRQTGRQVALYVERAFLPDDAPSPVEVTEYADAVITELQQRSYIGATHVVSPSWVEVAYTWQRPGSSWRQQALAALAADGIHQAGRYGRWHFQGIAESVADGFALGERMALRPASRRGS
jgi:protoporphyrinogen oxidase